MVLWNRRKLRFANYQSLGDWNTIRLQGVVGVENLLAPQIPLDDVDKPRLAIPEGRHIEREGTGFVVIHPDALAHELIDAPGWCIELDVAGQDGLDHIADDVVTLVLRQPARHNSADAIEEVKICHADN